MEHTRSLYVPQARLTRVEAIDATGSVVARHMNLECGTLGFGAARMEASCFRLEAAILKAL
jgi:hypothetical protein